MSTETTKKFDMKYFHYAVTAILIFGSQFLPGIGPLTPKGCAVVGTFLGAIYGWTFLDMLWPSIIGMIGLGCAMGTDVVLGASFGNPIIPMLIIVLAMVTILTDNDLINVIAKAFVTSRFTKGKPWLMVFTLYVGSFFCALINPFVSMILFMGIFLQICNKAGIKPFSPFPAVMLLGLALSVQIGKMVLPFIGTGLTLLGAYAMIQGSMPNFISFMAFMVPMGLMVVALYVLICKFVFRIDVSGIKDVDPSIFGKKEKLNADQKKAVFFLILLIVVLLVPSLLPKEWGISIFLNKITMFGQAALVVLLLMITKKKDGTPFFTFNSGAANGISWDAVFMTSFILAVSMIMNSDETGIKPLLSMMIEPFKVLSPMVFLVVIMFIIGIMTNIANNMTLATIFLPLVLMVAGDMGMEPLAVACILFLVTHLALCTPGASAFAGLAFAQTTWVKPKTMMKYGFIAVVILIPLFLALAIPYALLIF